MAPRRPLLCVLFALLLPPGLALAADLPAAPIAAKPLFRDPLFDGAADPAVIYHRPDKLWYLFYTSRRANVPGLEGASWAHGTPIGTAVSKDGATWRYMGTAQLNDKEAVVEATWASPELVFHDGLYSMFVTYVPGIFTDMNHPRRIVRFTSNDLVRWDFASTLPLGSLKVDDAAVLPMGVDHWRLWYRDEVDGGTIHSAESDDLEQWTKRGPVTELSGGTGGPKPFKWRGFYWMLRDTGSGLAVYRSLEAEHWTRAGIILDDSGTGKDDAGPGMGPDVIVNAGRAYIFYYTQPGTENNPRRSVIQMAQLEYDSVQRVLTCDRNKPVVVHLSPPLDPENQGRIEE